MLDQVNTRLASPNSGNGGPSAEDYWRYNVPALPYLALDAIVTTVGTINPAGERNPSLRLP